MQLPVNISFSDRLHMMKMGNHTYVTKKTPSLFQKSALVAFCRFVETYTHLKISEDEMAILRESVSVRTLKRRQYLLQAGEICQNLCFIVRGALRMYSVNHRGNEATMLFSLENDWLADRESMLLQQPSAFHIEALEDTDIIQVPYEQFSLLSKSISAFSRLFKLQRREYSIDSQKRMRSTLTMTAEERYHDLLEERPEYTQRFSQNLIASYLGIQPETLSRLRKR